jgi:hypothetical protein
LSAAGDEHQLVLNLANSFQSSCAHMRRQRIQRIMSIPRQHIRLLCMRESQSSKQPNSQHFATRCRNRCRENPSPDMFALTRQFAMHGLERKRTSPLCRGGDRPPPDKLPTPETQTAASSAHATLASHTWKACAAAAVRLGQISSHLNRGLHLGHGRSWGHIRQAKPCITRHN